MLETDETRGVPIPDEGSSPFRGFEQYAQPGHWWARGEGAVMDLSKSLAPHERFGDAELRMANL